MDDCRPPFLCYAEATVIAFYILFVMWAFCCMSIGRWRPADTERLIDLDGAKSRFHRWKKLVLSALGSWRDKCNEAQVDQLTRLFSFSMEPPDPNQIERDSISSRPCERMQT